MPSIRRARFGLSVVVLVAIFPSRAAPASERPRVLTVTRSGSGRPILFVPGLGSSGEVWQATVARWRKDHDCHVVELAGFAGRKSVRTDAFLEAARDDLVRYVQEQHLEHPILVGHSLGGFLALWAAATAPEQFGGVVSVDGVPFLSVLRDPDATPERMKAPAEALRRFYLSMSGEQLEASARMSAAGMVRSGTDVERIARWTSRSDSRTMAQAMFEMMTTDLRGDVAAIRVPTLLVAAGDGAGDAQAREKLVASYESQVARIPKHEVVLAEHARHFVMLDDPAFLEAAIARFLAGQEPVAAAGWAR